MTHSDDQARTYNPVLDQYKDAMSLMGKMLGREVKSTEDYVVLMTKVLYNQDLRIQELEFLVQELEKNQ